jgi:hypothetical protein
MGLEVVGLLYLLGSAARYIGQDVHRHDTPRGLRNLCQPPKGPGASGAHIRDDRLSNTFNGIYDATWWLLALEHW